MHQVCSSQGIAKRYKELAVKLRKLNITGKAKYIGGNSWPSPSLQSVMMLHCLKTLCIFKFKLKFDDERGHEESVLGDLCIFTCLARPDAPAKPLPHMGHLYGLSPV